MSTRHGFYWNSAWAASLTQARRDELGGHERVHLRRHLYKLTQDETEAVVARIEMFERGEPCLDVTDTETTVYYTDYGSADGRRREQDLREAREEIEAFLQRL